MHDDGRIYINEGRPMCQVHRIGALPRAGPGRRRFLRQ